MPKTGGLAPYDQANAMVGPCRVLWAPTSVAVPGDLWDIIPAIATAGEYVAKTGWNDFGLSADAPSFGHSRETEALDFEQAGGLFESLTEVKRTATLQIAEMDPANVRLIEEGKAPTTIAASANESAGQKVSVGLYKSLTSYRICFIGKRPAGAATVTEPSGAVRSPMVARIFPAMTLGSDDTDIEIAAADPVNAEVSFTVVPDPTLGVNAEHGYWYFETAGTISAT